MSDPDGRRALNEWERDAIDQLKSAQASAKGAGDTELADAIGATIDQISSYVAGLKDGNNGSDGFQAAIWGINNIGNANFGFSGLAMAPNAGPIRPGSWKCNIFVSAAYGYGAGREFPVERTGLGGLIKYPPVANELGDPTKNIAHLDVVSSPNIGDIVAFPSGNPQYLGHSALSLGGVLVVYAGEHGGKLNTVSRTSGQLGYTAPLVYRRYKP